jgi:hypothetical protein
MNVQDPNTSSAVQEIHKIYSSSITRPRAPAWSTDDTHPLCCLIISYVNKQAIVYSHNFNSFHSIMHHWWQVLMHGASKTFRNMKTKWTRSWKIQSVPHSKHSVSVIQTSQLMLYREIIAVCSEIHIKHINTLCGQNVELFNIKLVVYIVTTGP